MTDSFQRQRASTEFAKLEQLELAQPELDQLEEPVLQKAASSLKLEPAHFALGSFSLFLGGGGFETSRRRGGVLEVSFPPSSLYQLDSACPLCFVTWAQACQLLGKRSFLLLLQLSNFKILLSWCFPRKTAFSDTFPP